MSRRSKAPGLLINLPDRLQPFLEWNLLATFVLIYASELFLLSLFRYGGLVSTSIAVGEHLTAARAVLAAAGDIIPTQQVPVFLIGTALVALNLLLLIEYVRRIKSIMPLMVGAGAGFGATIAFMLGFACLSCSVVVATFLSTILSASALPTFLAWGGEAFLWGGIAALGILTLLLFKKTTDPLVC